MQRVMDMHSPTDDNNDSGADGEVDKRVSLLCWGCGEFGQHCHGHNNDVSFRESEVSQFASTAVHGAISHIACGSSHTVAVTDSGEVYTWGNGNSGQLGCGDQTPRLKPTVMPLSPPPPPGVRVRASACGSRHTMLLLDNGYVYACGNNFYAQLGYNFRQKNYKENQIRPQFLEFLKHRPVRQVACGDKHSLFLFDSGAMSAVGNNAHGQIGDGGRGESTVPKAVEMDQAVTLIACGPNHNLAITDTGDVFAWGYGKACGRRRHDVTSPEPISFKGRQVVQVSGGSSHSLALTAGGKVYAWGFGMDGQLGLGSVVMATRPRRLRHSFLEEGASSVACGDVFSAVVTVSGRLYMWGRNSHTIEGGVGSLHKVREPLCMNPEPSQPVRHVVCGAWHAAALPGLPDFVPMSEDSDSDTSDDEAESSSANSGLSAANGEQGDGSPQTNGEGPAGHAGIPVADVLEVSAPPQATSPRGVPPGQRPVFPVARAKTKLTIGEFYATSESMPSSGKSSPAPPAVASAKQPPSAAASKPQSPEASGQHRVMPLVVEMPTAPMDPESDVEEPLPVSTKEEMALAEAVPGPEPTAGVTVNPLSEPSPRREAVSGNTDGEERDSATSRQSKSEAPSEWPPSAPGGGPCEPEGENETASRGGGGGGSSVGAPPLIGSRSRTSFVATSNPTVQISSSPAKNYTMPRERSIVVSRNVDILDASQLLVGVSGPPKTAAAATPAGRPYGLEGHGSGYFHEGFGGFPHGFDDLEDFDFDYLEASPRPFNKDMAVQHVPTHHLEGDFGARPAEVTFKQWSEEKAARSRSALTSRDLDWIDQLLLQKVISQGPRQAKTSSSFFGALSGQMTRSPTKFFRKPTPSAHLSRTTTPASHTPTPHSSFAKTLSFIGLRGGGGGGGGGGRGTESVYRPGTRGLGLPAGGGGRSTAGGGGGGGGTGLAGPQRASSTAANSLPLSRRALQGGQDSQRPSAKMPVFSSAASWRQRPLEALKDLLDDGKVQSAPSSSNAPGRKRVAFADQRSSSSGGGVGPAGKAGAKPSLGSAVAAAAVFQNTPPPAPPPPSSATDSGVNRGGTANAAGANSRDLHEAALAPGNGHVSQGEGHAGNGGPTRPAPVPSFTGNNNGGGNSGIASKDPARKPAPTLSYRTMGSNRKDAAQSKTTAQPPAPRSGGLRTLLGSSKQTTALNPSPLVQGRSRTQLVVSGSGDRGRKARFD